MNLWLDREKKRERETEREREREREREGGWGKRDILWLHKTF